MAEASQSGPPGLSNQQGTSEGSNLGDKLSSAVKKSRRGNKKTQGDSSKTTAVWTDEEHTTIVNYLYENRWQVADGATFKRVTMNKLNEHLHTVHHDCPQKDVAQLETKWKAIKGLLATIEKYKMLSGRHWDPKLGANIEGTSAEATWKNDIKKHPSMKHFKHGWDLYDKMVILYPAALTRGQHQFSPRSAASVSSSVPVLESVGAHSAPDSHGSDDITLAEPPATATGPTMHANTEDEHMVIDDDNTSSARGNTTSTFISSVKSGKRKAADVDSQSINSQSVTSQSIPPPSSSIHASSAASATSSTGEKKRKVKKEVEATASMQSSSRSHKKSASVSSTVMHQQILSRYDNIMDLLSTTAVAPPVDPVAVRQQEAITLLESDKDLFSLTDVDFAAVVMAFSSQPGVVTSYLALKIPSVRRIFLEMTIGKKNREM